MADKRFDAVVIGGGIIGTSITYYLSKKGINVALLERDDIASGASGACDGFIFLQSKLPGKHLELAKESVKIYETLSEELTCDLEYRKCGGMIVIETNEELEYMRSRRANVGSPAILSPKEAREIEPLLSDKILGCTYSPDDGQINPFKVCFGFAEAAKKIGAKIFTQCEVLKIKNREVITNLGSFKAENIINAAGAWAGDIGKMANIDIPIKPRRGQVLVSEDIPRMINSVILSAKYLMAKFSSNDPLGLACPALGGGFSIEQTEDGNLLIGSTREFVGYNTATTFEAFRAITAQATGLMPQLSEVNIIRSFAGLRPWTPNGLPIIGRNKDKPWFIAACGHEGDGIALAPITGKIISDLF